jgi:hypothetical protein
MCIGEAIRELFKSRNALFMFRMSFEYRTDENAGIQKRHRS